MKQAFGVRRYGTVKSEPDATDYERRVKMAKKPIVLAAMFVSIAIFTAVPASAQSSTGPTWQDTVSQHHQLQYQMMKDMTQEMSRMTEQMSQGALTPDQSKEMAKR